MLDVVIKTIPHGEQRYDTAGDWYSDGLQDIVRVSECGNRKFEWLLAVHELIERILCEHHNLSELKVDQFDLNHTESEDPGDEVDAPYRDLHCFAIGVERMLASAMGIPWKEYEDTLNRLGK